MYGKLTILALIFSMGLLSSSLTEADALKDLDALKLCAKAGVDPAEIITSLAGGETVDSGVMAVELETLRKAYLIAHPGAVQASVGDLSEGLGADWVPAYFRAGRLSVEEETVVATGVLSETLLELMAEQVRSLDIDTLDASGPLGWVVLFRDRLPEFMRSREVLVRLADGEIVGWPHLRISGDLNIPAFTWRLTLVNGAGDPVIAEWPVVVGRTTKRTPRTMGLVQCDLLHHYPHWIDPETGKYVAPGPWNPLGIWKLMPTKPKKAMWYYHGTNQPKLLNRVYRAFSHGCIRNRNENIAHIALFMLTRNAGEMLPSGGLTGALQSYGERRNRQIPLYESVPVANRYHCLEAGHDQESGEPTMWVYPDVYWFRTDDGHAHRTVNPEFLVETLKTLGLDTDHYDPAEWPRMARRLRSLKTPERYRLSELKVLLAPAELILETSAVNDGKQCGETP